MLDHMSPTTLEVVRDYCAEQTRGITGTSGEFRCAWIELVVDHLNDARTLEWRLCCGITGWGIPGLDEHMLPPSSKNASDHEDENGNDECYGANSRLSSAASALEPGERFPTMIATALRKIARSS
jgi:hypothetical protein